MHILIAGASGLIGKPLVSYLEKEHQLTVLGRDINTLISIFPPNIQKITWDNLPNHKAKPYGLVINLSGASIGERRWNSAVKNTLMQSRLSTNKMLVDWIMHQNVQPRFFCANAIGIYGTQETSSQQVDEDSPLPLVANGFLQEIGLAWERSLHTAHDKGIPVTTLRFGVVLKKGEGMLKKLEFPFRLGLGSVIGSGNQILSWVHYQDLVNAIAFLIANPQLTGPINITSPYPVSQRSFAKRLASVLKRPLFIKMPARVVKLLFGEMGEELLLKGQKVVPKRLAQAGFKFSYPDIVDALSKEYLA
ncbi:MAG: TIGR01777 family protein [Legionella sp.]|nr:TIGR01777 family protein [Legionella sp.]